MVHNPGFWATVKSGVSTSWQLLLDCLTDFLIPPDDLYYTNHYYKGKPRDSDSKDTSPPWNVTNPRPRIVSAEYTENMKRIRREQTTSRSQSGLVVPPDLFPQETIKVMAKRSKTALHMLAMENAQHVLGAIDAIEDGDEDSLLYTLRYMRALKGEIEGEARQALFDSFTTFIEHALKDVYLDAAEVLKESKAQIGKGYHYANNSSNKVNMLHMKLGETVSSKDRTQFYMLSANEFPTTSLLLSCSEYGFTDEFPELYKNATELLVPLGHVCLSIFKGEREVRGDLTFGKIKLFPHLIKDKKKKSVLALYPKRTTTEETKVVESKGHIPTNLIPSEKIGDQKALTTQS